MYLFSQMRFAFLKNLKFTIVVKLLHSSTFPQNTDTLPCLFCLSSRSCMVLSLNIYTSPLCSQYDRMRSVKNKLFLFGFVS